ARGVGSDGGGREKRSGGRGGGSWGGNGGRGGITGMPGGRGGSQGPEDGQNPYNSQGDSHTSPFRLAGVAGIGGGWPHPGRHAWVSSPATPRKTYHPHLPPGGTSQ